MQHKTGQSSKPEGTSGRSALCLPFILLFVFLLVYLTSCSLDPPTTALPTPTPSPTPTPTPSPTVGTKQPPQQYVCDAPSSDTFPSQNSPTITPAVTPRPSPTQKKYDDAAMRFFMLVRTHQCKAAYAMLSKGVQQRESYAKFDRDDNYVLSEQCWSIIQIGDTYLEADRKTWNIALEIAVSQRCQQPPRACFDWDMHLQMQGDRILIVHPLWLYGAATGKDCISQ